MPNEQIVNYIRTQKQSGVPIERIKITLLQSGWKQSDVDAAILRANQPATVQTQKPQPQKQQVLPQQQKVTTPNQQQTTPSIQQNEQTPKQSKQGDQVPIELKKFVSSSLQQGKSKMAIAASLKNADWDEQLINLALGKELSGKSSETSESSLPPLPKQKMEDVSEKEDIDKKEETDPHKEKPPENQLIPIDKEISFTDNLTIPLLIIKSKLFTILGIQIVPLFITVISNIVFPIITKSSSLTIVLSLTFVSTFVFSILNIWSQTALIYSLDKEEEGIFTSYFKSIKRLLPFIITILTLSGVLITGSILFVIPAIVFAVWYIFAPFITITDKTKGAKALATSRNYVRDKFWTILLRGLLIGILILIIFSILGAISSGLTSGSTIMKSVWDFVQSLLQIIVITYSSVFMYVLFVNIKETKDSIPKPKKGFVWATRIMSWLGCGGVLLAIGVLVFLIGNALWAVYQELSATGNFSMEAIQELVNSLGITNSTTNLD